MEDCHKAGDAEDQSADVRKLGVIIVELMENGTMTNEETVVLKRPEEWSESAIEFLRDSSDVAARNLIGVRVKRHFNFVLLANKLPQHPFLKISCGWNQLKGLIAAAKISTYRPWNPCEGRRKLGT